MRGKRSNYIFYTAIILDLLLFLQGCMTTKTGQLSIPLPKNISTPSALVIKDKYIGVLSMDGKFDPLYKVNGSILYGPKEIIDSNNKKSLYFLIKSKYFMSKNCSLWDLDFSSKRLNCLIPTLRNVSSTNWIYLTPDKKYFAYPVAYLEPDKNISGPYGLYYNGIFGHNPIYSIKLQKNLIVPDIKDLKLVSYNLALLTDNCLLFYKNKKNPKDKTRYMYLWNLKNNALNQILFPGLKDLQIGWMSYENTSDPSQIIITLGQTLNKDDMSFDFSNKTINRVYVVDARNLKSKFLFSATSDFVTYYKEYNWYLFYENNYLCRYDAKLEKKERLYYFADYSNFYVFNNKSILVYYKRYLDIFEILSGNLSSYNSNPICYLMKPDGNWLKINDLFKNEIIEDIRPVSFDFYLFSIRNKTNGIHQVIKWNPLTNAKEIILEIKECIHIDISLSIDYKSSWDSQIYSSSQPMRYMQFKVRINEKENQNYIYDQLNKKIIYVPVLNSPIRWVHASDQLIWIYEKIVKGNRIFLLDWNDPANDNPKINFNERRFQKRAFNYGSLSPDKTYITIFGYNSDFNYTGSQVWFVNILTGKELTFPESKDFEFITWLEDK